MLNKFLQDKLNERIEKGTLRSLSSFEGNIDFLSNDFLGLAKENDRMKGALASTGSRLISGNSARLEEMEKELADFFLAEAGLLFNSGYQANLALFSSIPDKNALVLYDKEVHASVRDGLKMSDARAVGFKHNDPEDLERLLKRFRQEAPERIIYVAVEGLYSMSGEVSPIETLILLCKQYNAVLIVDEAHSTGIYGEEGKGIAAKYQTEFDGLIRLVTFGKAFGAHGAIVLGSKLLKQYLINFARPLIYTTGISEREAERILFNVTDPLNTGRRKKLADLISRFRSELGTVDLIADSSSPIQVIRGNRSDLIRLNELLKEANIASKVILPPTVSEGKECLRVVIHSSNTQEELDTLIKVIKGV